MPAEDVMVKNSNKQIKSFAPKLPQLLPLAASLLILGCAGTRNETESQTEAGRQLSSKAPAGAPAQTAEITPGENAPVNASSPAPRPNEGLQNGAAKATNGTSVTIEQQYQPFKEAEIKQRLQVPLAMEDCIRIALHQNYALRLAKHDLSRSEASLRGSSGKFLPVFSLKGTQENTQERLPFNPLTPTAPTRLNTQNNFLIGEIQQTLGTGAVLNFSGDLRDLYSANKNQNLAYAVTLTQPLLRGAWPMVARSPVALARHDRYIREYHVRDAKLDIIYATKRAFYNVLLARELIEVSQIAVKRDSTLIVQSESMMKAKRATQRDVLSAEIRLADDRAALIRSETEYQVALDALKEILGAPLDMNLEVIETKLKFSPVELHDDELIRLALNNNPVLQGASVAVERAQLSYKVARNETLPQLDLTVGHSGLFDQMMLNRQELTTSGFLASFTLSYPFLNREASGAAENAQVAISQEQDRLTNLQRQIVLNIRSIVHNARSTEEELTALNGTITASQQKVDFATTMFNLGRASNLDITDAQEDLLKAQNQYLEKLVDYYAQLALLESLTGRELSQ
jgi:outer membrane protein TolC